MRLCVGRAAPAGRENGGNCDIKNLSRGCKVYFPVFVEGANLSVGALLASGARRLRVCSGFWADDVPLLCARAPQATCTSRRATER